jgi:hypothetical protein
MTSPRQLSGIMKARVACKRDRIKLGETPVNDSKAGDIALCSPTRNETLQSDIKFYEPVGCAAVPTCDNLCLN